MKPERTDWQILEDTGKPDIIGIGADSTVFLQKSKKSGRKWVIKDYDYLTKVLGTKVVEEILTQYNKDTETASELLIKDPNPLHQEINIDGEAYRMNYSIENQGGIYVTGEDGQSSAVAGQRFVSGLNMWQVRQRIHDEKIGWKGAHRSQLPLAEETLHTSIANNIKDLYDFLNTKLGAKLVFDENNTKTFLDEKNRSVEVKITDLASNLVHYFLNSPAFKSLREEHGYKNN